MGFFSRLFSSEPQSTTPEREGSSMSADDSRHGPSEDHRQPAQGSSPTSSEPTRPAESIQQGLSMSDLHSTITEALDMLGLEYVQNEDREHMYLIGRDGVLLRVGVKGMDDVPAGIVIVAIVLRNVECTKELAVDLLKRNGRATFATWEISDGSDGTVDLSFSYQLSAEQLDVELVARMVHWVLSKATEEIDALQAKYGGDRAFVVKEEPEEPPPATIMPTGPLTFVGRYPGYEPAQAMAAFLSVPGKDRPSYQVLRDYIWAFKGAGEVLFDREGHEVVVGCCAEPDGTPVVVVTGFCEPNSAKNAEKVMALMLGEKIALKQAAHSVGIFNEGDLGEIAASGALRQLRPSEIGAIPDSVEGEPASSVIFDRNLRFDGLYYAEYPFYRSYLRFYPDGTVLEASTSGRPEQVAHWFSKAHADLPKGTYTFQGLSIEFSTTSSDRTVDYEGAVHDEALELRSHSHTNGHKDQKTFSFVQVALQ